MNIPLPNVSPFTDCKSLAMVTVTVAIRIILISFADIGLIPQDFYRSASVCLSASL